MGSNTRFILELLHKQCDVLLSDLGAGSTDAEQGLDEEDEERLILLQAKQMQISFGVGGGSVKMSQAGDGGDTFNVPGRAAVVAGRGSQVSGVNYVEAWEGTSGGLDLNVAVTELALLRAELKKLATTSEEDAALGAVAGAEIAAGEGDGARMLELLGRAGSWALAVAEKVGIPVAVAALRAALGL